MWDWYLIGRILTAYNSDFYSLSDGDLLDLALVAVSSVCDLVLGMNSFKPLVMEYEVYKMENSGYCVEDGMAKV